MRYLVTETHVLKVSRVRALQADSYMGAVGLHDYDEAKSPANKLRRLGYLVEQEQAPKITIHKRED